MVLTEYNPKKHIQNEKNISREEGREEGRKEGMAILITTCRSLGITREQTQEKLMEQYKLSEEEAVTAMKEHWDTMN